RVDWQTPGFDLETDARVVSTAAGEIIAYASAWDTSEPHVRVGSFCRIHPDHALQNSHTASTSSRRAGRTV
ncbi:hypothetical protein ACFLSF_05000, partial [Candidatus Bipolaricaulota bacterium]